MKLFKYYSLDLIIVLLITILFSVFLKMYVLGGIILIALTLCILMKSFRDKSFNSKKLITKICIYFFITVFLFDGVILLNGNPII